MLWKGIMLLNDVVIVDGVRTPFVKAGTLFNRIPAYELGRIATSELLARTELDSALVEEVIFGNCGQPSEAANIARVIALNSHLSKDVPAYTVQRNCGSGMEAVVQAALKIHHHETRVAIAGGTESMSNIPLFFPKVYADFLMQLSSAKNPFKKISVLTQFRLKFFKPRIGLLEGLTDPFCGLSMGQTAEILAREWGISRQAQDEFALRSHQKTLKAQDDGKFLEEITPVYIPPKYDKVATQDLGPRQNQTITQLGRLSPYFEKRYGTVTVGNSCQVTDGAVSLLIMKRDFAVQSGYRPLSFIRGAAFCGIEPERMGLGPVIATKLALKNAGLQLSEIGLIELNEAFSAQVLSVYKAFSSKAFAKKYLNQEEPLGEINPEIVNVNGGAIALGHPVGASGARIILTLAKEMKRRNVQFGLAMICIGGGQGGAVILERKI